MPTANNTQGMATATTEPSQSTPTSADKGFQLSFASDQAFARLLTDNTVQLYYLQPNAAWQWQGKWTPVDGPARYYPMDKRTVPDFLSIESTNSWVGSKTRGDYVVVLPAAIEQRITHLLSQFDSGLLAIDARGKVRRLP